MAYSSRFESQAPIVVASEQDYDAHWSPELNEEDLRELQEAQNDPSKIISRAPREANLLGYYSIFCLIFNRMIGTGIFNSASIVFSGTQSIGVSIVLWALGAVVAMAGVFVYIELGLSIPRWPCGPNGGKVATPRNGEAIFYFNYMLKKPLFLATCLFGITFLVLENTSANSVSFAQSILDASHKKHTPGKIIAIAVAANTFTCLLHAISRKAGIWLNNILGTIKFFMLLFIVIIGLVWMNRDVASTNYDSKTSFSTQNSPRLPYRYAEAFTYILYPYTGFHQINYIISELKEPRRTFPRAQFWGVLTVALIYTAVIMIYAAVIPKAELFTRGGIDVGARFFQLTLGKITSKSQVQTIFSTLKAISAMGNMIVVTFTAARVKQEIAKEGILPYSLVFSQSYDFSLGRIFGRKSSNPDIDESLSVEKTPAAALALHWALTTLLVIAAVLAVQTRPYSATAAQSFLAGWFVYDIDIICFSAIAVGLLCLRFTPRVNWAQKSEFKHPIISIASSCILLTGCVFPLIFIWYHDPAFPYLNRSQNAVRWFVGQTAGVSLIAFSFLYWVGFRSYIKVRSERNGEKLYVKREPMFKQDAKGRLTQILEIVTLEWRKEVGLQLDDIEEMVDAKTASSVVSPVPGYASLMRSNADFRERYSSGVGSDVTYEVGDGQSATPFRRKPEMHEMDG